MTDRQRILVVGAGGLGTPALATLAAAGSAALRIVDPDTVELSNLPRQLLYAPEDLGQAKVEVAAGRLRTTHPNLDVQAFRQRLDADSANELLAGCSVVLDATDGLSTKVLLNELCLHHEVPLVHAGVLGLEGQLMTILPHRSACLRCLFPEPPDESETPTCQQSGILGPVVAAIGVEAAREAFTLWEGRQPHLANRLAILDAARMRWRAVELRPNPRCPSCRAARTTQHSFSNRP